MGCDIHPYIEVVHRGDNHAHAKCWAEPDIGRNYTLFSLLAGVRHEPERAEGVTPGVPKGLPPPPLSWVLLDAAFLTINDKFAATNAEGYCSRADATRWNMPAPPAYWPSASPGYGPEARVMHPDWHSHSWLGIDELQAVQEQYARIETAPASWWSEPGHGGEPVEVWPPDLIGQPMRELRPGYYEVGERKPLGPHRSLGAVIAAMQVLAGEEAASVRLVFWFDN